MTSNSFADCDRMFIPEFFELAKYAVMRFNAEHMKQENSQELADL